MTRFARAKGSKASNERAPDDSTPWEVMKEQLLQAKKDTEESKKRHEAETQRLENYQNFLNERKVQKKKAVWCDFPETETAQQDQPKKKKKKVSTDTVSETPVNVNTVKISPDDDVPKNKKKKKKSKPLVESDSLTVKENEMSTEELHVAKKKKNQKSPVPFHGESDPTTKTEKQKELAPKAKNPKKGKKNKKFVDGKPVRRKEITDRSFQLIINGKDVELVRFDGFPIMKKDAERLQELKNSMIKKGIPKSEVQRTMKLERRRAEKALARLKRDVCYNCRKGGHNLSDCPDLKSKIPGLDAAEGVCFKCGSTEHKQFECKVQKNMDFKFATCFICKEPGHIARQCPDNPKGLYPNGGCCKLCGDVTHLRKDCPTVQDKREESSIKLQTLISDNNIESIGAQNTAAVTEKAKAPKKIKF